MFDNQLFRELIIRPTLKMLELYSEDAEELLILTMAQESDGGTYFKQIHGPALGAFQMEPATHDDIWNNYILKHHDLKEDVIKMMGVSIWPPDAKRMIFDLEYAVMMARIFYERVPEKLPLSTSIPDIAVYYKKYWNTSLGKATIDGTIKAYHRFIGHKV